MTVQSKSKTPRSTITGCFVFARIGKLSNFHNAFNRADRDALLGVVIPNALYTSISVDEVDGITFGNRI